MKVYYELIHDILLNISKGTLDDISQTAFTVRTRIYPQTLLQRWTDMTHKVRVNRLERIIVEFTIQMKLVVDEWRLCNEYDLFRLGHVTGWLWRQLCRQWWRKSARSYNTLKVVKVDSAEVCLLIKDFLDYAEWSLHDRVRNRTMSGLLLTSTYDSRFLPQHGIYNDRVSAARHFVGIHGVAWSEYVRCTW